MAVSLLIALKLADGLLSDMSGLFRQNCEEGVTGSIWSFTKLI